MPDSSPGPKMSRGRSGSSPAVEPTSASKALPSAQLAEPVASSEIRACSWLNETQSMLFSVEVMTEIPSIPRRISMNAIPFASQISISSSFRRREALVIGTSPSQNFLAPSPEPGPSTAMATPLFSAPNTSACSKTMGNTVEDPETRNSPSISPESATAETAVPVSLVTVSSPPHAAAMSARMVSRVTSTRARRTLVVCMPRTVGIPHLHQGSLE